MGYKMSKYYKTNNLKSVFFYLSFFLPILMIYFAILMLPSIKKYWPALVFLYMFFIPLEFIAIKYRKTEVNIDDNGIEIKSGNKISKANWNEITKFEVLLFNWGWELSYQLVTKDKKILGFGDSLHNYDDLIKEIESRTGLKLKKTL